MSLHTAIGQNTQILTQDMKALIEKFFGKKQHIERVNSEQQNIQCQKI